MNPTIQKLIDKAVEMMAKSKDPVHDDGHISRLLDSWNKLSVTIKKPINCETVILALCWHDIWRCQTKLPGALGLIFGYLIEGKKSARIFGKYAKKYGLDKRTIKKTKRIIKNHPDLPWIDRKTIEDRIMWDLDNLDEWSFERLEAWTKQMGTLSWLKIKLITFYFNLKMIGKSRDDFYFDWSRQEFDRRKNIFLGKVEEYQKVMTTKL